MNDDTLGSSDDRRRPAADRRSSARDPAESTVGSVGARAAALLFELLDPIPYGCFLAALVFDAVYALTAVVFWVKSAAWLIAMGLLFAVVPRLIDLARVWWRGGRPRAVAETIAFWLNFCAIAAAVVNAFVHSRDAYGVMPTGLWLSGATMVLLMLATGMRAVQPSKPTERS